MDRSAASGAEGRYRGLELPNRGLKALSRLEGPAGGPLSPLARLRSPDGPDDSGALVAAWENLEGAWSWSVPALLDPHRTIALVMGDGNTNLIGQYLFPDAEAYGPGFHVELGGEAVRLTGPLSLGMLRLGLYSHLALEEADEEVEPFRLDLAADHFWALMACMDAYRAAVLERRLKRAGGAPPGVGIADVAKAWADGVSSVNPGWAVSLFFLIAPDRVPQDLAGRLPGLLTETVRQGHLEEAAHRGGGEALYSFSEGLSPLLWGLTAALNFGLVTQRLTRPQAAESTVLGGWRTPGGVCLADLSEAGEGVVALAMVGPETSYAVIDGVLGDDALAPPWEEFSMDTHLTRESLVSRLRALPREEVPEPREVPGPGERPRHFCSACGNEFEEGFGFCSACGKERADAAPVGLPCRACGSVLGEGASFCSECGSPVSAAAPGGNTCPGCGMQMREGARFCRRCGRPR